jgi:hypothetical protein
MRRISERAAIIVSVISVLFFPQNVARGQELEVLWADYLATESRLEAAMASERLWVEQRHGLLDEIGALQESQAWYNGWIIELAVARRSAQQVALADSLRDVRVSIAEFQDRRDDAFSALRRSYQQKLLESGSRGSLSPTEKEQAITMGQRLIGRDNASLDLPDYAPIANSSYENEDIKHLVLKDLQFVLEAKLGMIDSLVTEKETEAALLARLDEFHRDLGYQMRSNLDLEGGSEGTRATSESPGNEGFFGDGEEGGLTVAVGGENRYSDVTKSAAPTTMNPEPVPTTETDFPLGMYPVDEALHLLKVKRQEYHDLLQHIETELLY